jgi:hypothetical protein
MKAFEVGNRLDILVTLVEKYEETRYRVRPMPTDIAKYSIELFKQGGVPASRRERLDRHADLKVARSIYRAQIARPRLLSG